MKLNEVDAFDVPVGPLDLAAEIDAVRKPRIQQRDDSLAVRFRHAHAALVCSGCFCCGSAHDSSSLDDTIGLSCFVTDQDFRFGFPGSLQYTPSRLPTWGPVNHFLRSTRHLQFQSLILHKQPGVARKDTSYERGLLIYPLIAQV